MSKPHEPTLKEEKISFLILLTMGMRDRNTVEYLGLWETLNYLDFKGAEFDTFRNESSLCSFNLTPRKWFEATNAEGIIPKLVV